jgi:Acetyltransferases
MTHTTETEATRLALPEAPPMAGLLTRFLVADSDYEPAAELIRVCHAYDGTPWLPTADNLRFNMISDGVDPARDVVLVEADGRLVGVTGVERVVRDDTPVFDVWGKIAPELRQRGIGSWLLDWTLRRARQRADAEDPRGTVMVQARAEEHEIGARAIYERAGFKPVRHFFLMRHDALDQAPDAPLPDGLEIRPVRPDQHRTIFEAENEAFRDHWGSREHGEDAFRQTFGQAETNTDLWVVAWDGDQVAGAVENWIWPDENERLGVHRGWLEQISVRRPWRRRGLGRALTAASLIRLREAGMGEAMLGVDAENPNGALGLYEGLGFVVARRSAAYRRPLER